MNKNPHPVDLYVGQRLRERRILLGISQEGLGHTIGLTFQQIQKYERGTNRISASKLYLLSTVLEVPVAYFFEGLKSPAPSKDDITTILSKREILELAKNYYALPKEVRKQLLILTKKAAKHFSEKT